MEYFEERDLSTFITEAKTSERDAKDIAENLLQALVMIHSQGFTHRDLKPQVSAPLIFHTSVMISLQEQNIFVVQTSPRYWVKLGDFGISKRISNQSTALRTEVGTRAFTAPETTPDDYEESFQYTNAVDMWSLGCVIYNVLAHSLPYKNSHAKRFPFPTQPLKDRVSNRGINLLECLLTVDPSLRWTAQKAAKHPWLEASCEASSAGVKNATEDANFVAQPKGPSEYQNRFHHPNSAVNMPTVISSMEKTRPRPADRSEAPINQLVWQSSSRHGESSQFDSSSNSDRHRRTTSEMMDSPSKYRSSDSFVDTGTETLKPRRVSYHKPESMSHELHEDDTAKESTALPGMPAVASRALKTGIGTSYGSSKVVDESATQEEPLMKVHHPDLAVRGRQVSEEQGSDNMELVTILREFLTQGGIPKQTKIDRALELIRQGIDLEIRSNGETALHLAVRIYLKHHVGQILLDLLQAGADVDARNNVGKTGLHTALCCIPWFHCENRTEVVKQLVNYKTDVNAKDKFSFTPLHYAAAFSAEKEFDVLLEAGARINEISKNGGTALHTAVSYSPFYGVITAEKLILAGINMDKVNNSGKTALDIARDVGSSHLVKAIEEAQKQRRSAKRERRYNENQQVSTASQLLQDQVSNSLCRDETRSTGVFVSSKYRW